MMFQSLCMELHNEIFDQATDMEESDDIDVTITDNPIHVLSTCIMNKQQPSQWQEIYFEFS